MSEVDDDTIHVDGDHVTVNVDVPLKITWTDVDSTWNGKGSLDEHRQKELAKVKQPGFGDAGKAKSNGE
jgi:hypothetical protein